MISSLLSSFCIRIIWIYIFFIRADCPGNSPDRQMSDCLLLAFVTVVCRNCFAFRVQYGSCARSKASNTYCADCNSSKRAQYFNALKACIRAGDKLQQLCNYKACHSDGKSHSGMCLSYGLPGTGKFSSTNKKRSLVCLSST